MGERKKSKEDLFDLHCFGNRNFSEILDSSLDFKLAKEFLKTPFLYSEVCDCGDDSDD
jgi:hypothetical protein